MGILISIQNVTKHYGSKKLFHDISLGLYEGEKLGLIGPNGTGKSTLLKIIMGHEDADEGDVVCKKGLKLAYVSQADLFDQSMTVEQVLMQSMVHQRLDETQKAREVNKYLSLLEFENALQIVKTLSGGWKKRLAIGCALIQEPDILLMDEPTNHLDMEGVLWLEQLLKTTRFAFVIITHDRYFLENTTNRIIELSPCYATGFLKTEGNYSEFIQKREAYLLEQEKQELILSNKVRRETDWLRQGPKARTSKSKFRIDEAYELQDELLEVKKRNRAEKSVYFDFDSHDKKSKELIKTHQMSKQLGNKQLIDKLSMKLSPGMKIGLVGKNGCGKSTLMRLLAGKMQPDEGTIKPGWDVKIVSFDQDRAQLDPEESVKSALSPTGTDTVLYRNKPYHIVTWASKLLFKPEELNASVKSLSGGEQARILIGRLMLQPADILLLDEPTNDLDIPSLEILEQTLLEFPGAIILVTHDRYLLDRVANQIMSMDGKGGVARYADINQWLKQYYKDKKLNKSEKNKYKTKAVKPKKSEPKKLTYAQRKELDRIQRAIQKAEKNQESIKQKIQDPQVMANPTEMNEWCEKFEKQQFQIDQLYVSWEEIESCITRNL